MSSFLFLTFCVYVFCCLGLHFSAVPLSNPFFRWLLPVPYKPPQEPYTPPTGPVLCSASVVSLPCPQNRTQGRTGASSFFLPRTGLPLPLKGEGLVLAQLEVLRFCWIRPQLAHTSPTGPVWCCAGVVSLPAPQNRTQALTGPSLVFTVFFSHLFSLAAWSVATPGGNSPLLGWVGSCKAASRFSRCRPTSTRWSAGFR